MNIEASVKLALEKTTKHFVAEKKRSLRESNRDALDDEAIRRLREREAEKREKVTIKKAAWSVMKRAYLLASDNGRLPANMRQIMYAARPLVQKLTGGQCWKKSSLFTQNLLPGYMAAHEDETARWDVTADARGHFMEPHSRVSIGIGTLGVRGYLKSWTDSDDVGTDVEPPKLQDSFPTLGPANRFRYALFIEKEGFDPLLARAQIAARYDMAIFSSKGMSVIAARRLVDHLSQAGCTVFVLHDFDRAGLLIAHWLSHDNDRFQFECSPDVIDLGLRLEDVKRLGLEKESLVYKQKKNPADALLECDDVTREEIDFLVGVRSYKQWSGHRVELNALTSRGFIDWLEAKFKEHGVKKVIPDKQTLEVAWQRALLIAKMNEAVETVGKEFKKKRTKKRKAPGDLTKRVRELLDRHPELPWDKALVQIAASAGTDGAPGKG
jgi:predicted house-cleaning noncanonical NTP pyrophosphatase (MazG superfamily)